LKIKFNKKVAALLLTTSFALIPSSGLAVMENQNVYVETTTSVNMRLDNNTNARIICTLDEGKYAICIATDNGWSLVSYDGKIGYIKSDYLRNCGQASYPYTLTSNVDIAYTTANVNFRREPIVDKKNVISLIPKKSELEVIAVTNNEWLLVKYQGIIGYVKAEYTKSLKESLQINYPEIGDIKVKKVVYIIKTTKMYKNLNDDSVVTVLEKDQSCEVLFDYGNWYFVKSSEGFGFVEKKYTKELKGMFIIVDISDQRLKLYYNDDILVVSDVVTGKESTPTPTGLFEILSKQNGRTLTGADYSVWVDYWMHIGNGIGLHDSTRSKFGGTIYVKKGSHGCINLPKEIAKAIYNLVSKKDKVLIHQ